MDDFNRPIIPPDRVDHLRVEPIYPDKKESEEEKKAAEERKQGLSYGAVLVAFKKFFGFFKTEEKISPTTKRASSETDVIEDLGKLKKTFSILKDRDQSTNAAFAQNLSDLWLKLLTHYDQLRAQKGKIVIDLVLVKELIDAIEKYPPEEELSLSFYLTEHAGEKWLPFPFMGILKQLHIGYIQDLKGSVLYSWLTLIDKIVEPTLFQK